MTHLYSQYFSKVDCLYLKKWNVTFIIPHKIFPSKEWNTLQHSELIHNNDIFLIVIDLTEVTLNSSLRNLFEILKNKRGQWSAADSGH